MGGQKSARTLRFRLHHLLGRFADPRGIQCTGGPCSYNEFGCDLQMFRETLLSLPNIPCFLFEKDL